MSDRDPLDFGDDLPEDDEVKWWDRIDPPSSPDIQEILEEFGYDDFSEVAVDFSQVNPENLRGDRFVDFEDALRFLFRIGVLGFSRIWYDEDEDEFGVDVPDDSGESQR